MASLRRLASAGSRAVLLKPSAATLRGLSQPPTAPTALVVRSMASKASKADKTPLVLTETVNGVTTITMNRPDKLNGWTKGMMAATFEALQKAEADDATKVAVLTGTGKYYCAGVDLGGTVGLAMPKSVYEMIRSSNQQLFDAFLNFKKPMIVAPNGPAIGASVTSGTLVDAIIASDRATFSTPFSRLGVPPEGCSSVFFDRIMDAESAQRMLGPEGWAPTAAEAKDAGFVHDVVPHEKHMAFVQKTAEDWIATGRPRTFAGKIPRDEALLDELRATNAQESIDLATAFLGEKFLNTQYEFAKEKNKPKVAQLFWYLKTTRPVWSLML